MKAIDRIALKEDQKLYKKVGKKYIQVNDPYILDGLGEGWWLVKVAPSVKSIYSRVFPAKAELRAAAMDKRDQLVEIIREASEARPKEGVPLSTQAKSDWEWIVKRNPNDFNMLYYPSFHSCAEKIVDALVNYDS